VAVEPWGPEVRPVREGRLPSQAEPLALVAWRGRAASQPLAESRAPEGYRARAEHLAPVGLALAAPGLAAQAAVA
jgi:hypothetical protein